MLKKMSCLVVLTLCLLALVSSVKAEECLDVGLSKYADGAGFEYSIDFEANKDTATTGRLDIDTESYTLSYYSDIDGWEASGAFDDYYDEMSFTKLTAELAKTWIIIWDLGLSTQTTCTMNFGTVAESDWLDLPTLTYPLPADSPTPKDLTVAWTWSDDAPDSNLDCVEACVEHNNMDLEYWGELADDATSWTPPELAGGDWEAEVMYTRAFKDVPDGLTITGDAWDFGADQSWLFLDSSDWSDFTVVPEPITLSLMVIGGLAVLVRRKR